MSRVLLGAGIPLTAAFLLWGRGNVGEISSRWSPNNVGLSSSATDVGVLQSTILNSTTSNSRTRNTTADEHYARHGELPLPPVMHDVLPQASLPNGDEQKSENILVVGDVHGCFDELQQLLDKAVRENRNKPFEKVILVGDLCNKGPDSAKVIRFVRQQKNWFAVRGNHDDGALAAALGDETRRKKKKYKWVMEGEKQKASHDDSRDVSDELSNEDGNETKVTLSDDDVLWMSRLPYSITIPGSHLGESFDTVIVHGGFIPGEELHTQAIETMITIREVLPVCKGEEVLGYEFHEREDGKEAIASKQEVCHPKSPLPWALVWNGPHRVIFGHDARRGLQRYEGDWAIGLDTGAVYGRQMTAIILPERKLVSINTAEHSPVDND